MKYLVAVTFVIYFLSQLSGCSELAKSSEAAHEELAMRFFEEDAASQRMFASKFGESEIPQHVLLATMLSRCTSSECSVGDVVESQAHLDEYAELCSRKTLLKSEYWGEIVAFSEEKELLLGAKEALDKCDIRSRLRGIE
ncbi:MAG: hypothetical protein AAF529_11100 [Pseudomonadota bacterium]